jgi:hypothetical protein
LILSIKNGEKIEKMFCFEFQLSVSSELFSKILNNDQFVIKDYSKNAQVLELNENLNCDAYYRFKIISNDSIELKKMESFSIYLFNRKKSAIFMLLDFEVFILPPLTIKNENEFTGFQCASNKKLHERLREMHKTRNNSLMNENEEKKLLTTASNSSIQVGGISYLLKKVFL